VKFPGVAKFIEELKTSGIPVTELIEKNDNGKVIMQCAVIINEQETK
jgi:folate-dependent phosphoribosylglycinamide formyltransferase PurN